MAMRHSPKPTADESRALADREELVERLERALPAEGRIEPLPGVFITRYSLPGTRVHSVSVPAFGVIAQGSKEVLLGGRRYQYDPAHYLLTTAHLPVQSQVIDATPMRPYLSLRLNLDPTLVSSVMIEAGQNGARGQADVSAMDVSALDAGLLDAVVRLARLLDSPIESRFLLPLITREIIYRLLRGEQGDRLRHIAVFSGSAYRIARAIERLRKGYDQPLRIEEIARELGMSVSGFHHHFKAVTALSPLQFQKQLRLQEARRLMLGEGLDATRAAYRVGYLDASHFNREYKSFFGLPPMRDMEQLRDRVAN